MTMFLIPNFNQLDHSVKFFSLTRNHGLHSFVRVLSAMEIYESTNETWTICINELLGKSIVMDGTNDNLQLRQLYI
jgi:hypothetical protein